jgi:cyclopropane-fatty-acyl-phospholipid synthase
MWDAALDAMLRALLRAGTLEVTYPSGDRRRYGDGAEPRVAVRLRNRDTVRRLVLVPQLAVGEAYMDEGLTIAEDDLPGFLSLLIRNSLGGGEALWLQARRLFLRARRPLDQSNPRAVARANVAHHYDLPPRLYELFLDADRQYSCAYFRSPDATLEEAQIAKKTHIARKLLIKPGMRVLDIGCGWGGLALTLARDWGARVIGVTLSEEQLAVARRRAAAEGLADRVEFRLQDYREVPETFDRIVSVGMFEHVGLPNFGTYFGAVRDKLAFAGVALIHTIGNLRAPTATNPWIAKYIFPGGYIPSLSEIAPVIERSGLLLQDLEVWRLHYALTLDHWRRRFEEHLDELRAINDDRFIRMWRFYLIGSEMAFRHGAQAVFQLQLGHHVGSTPLTRDYLYR